MADDKKPKAPKQLEDSALDKASGGNRSHVKVFSGSDGSSASNPPRTK